MTRRPILIQSERLRLRELTLEDAGFILELVNEPDFLTHIGDKRVCDLAGARRFLREGSWTRQERAGLGQLLVEPLGGGEPLGVCGLLYRPARDLTDVGFAFLERHRGHGYATEAARAVIYYGRSQLGLERIVALTSPDNAASIRVLEKLGMRFQEVVHMSEDDPGTALHA